MKFEYAMFEFRGENRPQLLALPQSDGSGEGFALEQVLRIAQPDQAYFWATHQGAELDLLMFKNGQRVGVAFKRADAPPHDHQHGHRSARPEAGRAVPGSAPLQTGEQS